MPTGAAIALLASALALRCVAEPAATEQQETRHSRVRSESAELRAIFKTAWSRSATFKALVDRLERSTVVVYVRFGRSMGGAPARLEFMTLSGGDRFVLVTIDRVGISPGRLIGLLAHELQHAVELAEAPDVSDVEGFRRLYGRLGGQHSTRFETAEAAQIMRIVEGEIARQR
jgi:hypothetical protein